MAQRIFYALSTQAEDPELISSGIFNRGLIGFLEGNSREGTLPLEGFLLKFPRGDSYFYTMDPLSERFEGRSPRKLATLGYARVKPGEGYHLLNRYFLEQPQCHIFLPFPVESELAILGKRRDESGAMYVKSRQSKGDLPLFMYSNDSNIARCFTPIEEFALPVKEVRELIHQEGLLIGDFEFDERSVDEVNIQQTRGVGGLNIRRHSKGFKLSQMPADDASNSSFADIYSLDLLLQYVRDWLIQLETARIYDPNTKTTIGGDDQGNSNPSQSYYEYPSPYRFRNAQIEPVLNVTTQARIFVNLIDSIPDNEKGLLFGIFGKWGRGKTFFWKQVTQLFDDRVRTSKSEKTEHAPVKYSYVEFSAWKYQDTPASWAYLFESCVRRFYQRQRRVWYTEVRFKASWLNKVELNIKKFGWFKTIISFASVLFGIIWCFLISLDQKVNIAQEVISYVGVATIIGFVTYYWFYSASARGIFKQYFSDAGFSHLLGIQSEIQEEFKRLFELWVPENKIGKQRLVIFVDDLDRCSEDRIIQVIDSLKVMMDDEFFSRRAIIVAAVDESVLQRAIKLKYHSMVMSDVSIEDRQRRIELERTCREYMDKLFLNGFKLGNLSSEERNQVLLGLTNGRVHYSQNKKRVSGDGVARTVTVDEKNNGATSAPIGPKMLKLTNVSANEDNQIPYATTGVNAHDEFEVSEFEFNNLSTTIEKSLDATPRSIRIFYYRYLMARDFKEIMISNNPELHNEWQKFEGKELLFFLIMEYGTRESHDSLIARIRGLSTDRDDAIIEFTLFDKVWKVSKPLALALLKLVEVVVPY